MDAWKLKGGCKGIMSGWQGVARVFQMVARVFWVVARVLLECLEWLTHDLRSHSCLELKRCT